ncbi:polysaccharide pyruvyl transferase family protein [Enterococcus asini]|uniref:polysaccharide pyruvyl transferase family protein n=1 Tax=Enterococcus asini TaxID=57732 RepID=UPI00288EEAB2|nr:polysaccharide pyruvyl transferase family protein [Enterococcus asini]MDT2757489.1 polysaccharide pyruvyl transferase family protein [Enterococcus asini]
MKIAIQTIVDYNNYGNRLQNYALQKILENRDYEVVTLRNNFSNPYLSNAQPNNKIVKVLSSVKDGSFINKLSSRFGRKYKLISKYQSKRLEIFKGFSMEYIRESSDIYNEKLQNSDELKKFDAFIIGSDQVWNYSFRRFSEFDFLPLVNQPKISYAASFGVDTIPKNMKEIYSKNLSTLDYISVREDKGKDIIHELVPDKPAKVVLDPTLMLDKQEWRELIQDRKVYTDKFVLTYFLDEPTTENQKYISKIAKGNNLEVKKLANVFDEELWLADPAEFVNLFSQAEIVFTDSFHACVFSIIFEKYFEIFERNTKMKSMNSRIDTLMSNLHTGNRWHRGNSNLLELPDYHVINQYLEEQRKESYDFLESSLTECKKKLKVVDQDV